jgi:phosphatidylserine/phosphatidylglycerophosphate/cardiolipin synthase-like enzyme
MKTFEFSTNVITKIISELQDADEYIRIAVFQIHNREVFNVLNNKLNEGVWVEIITLPYDSINEDIQAEVTSMFQNIERNGAKLYFCKWNVGDPERTSTAVGRWYSFHGKFIVTDKSAIALSANFTQAEELDAAIIFKNEIDKIEEYNRKFDELIDIFITENQGYSGTIRQRIADLEDDSSLFELPRVIETETHRSHWIRHYPAALCPVDIPVEDKLYLAPFDCRGRNFLMSLISEASEFAYISTESFTDTEFSAFLIKMRLKGLDIRILSGATSMDFQDRMNNMLRELLSQDIGIRTVEDIHAKLIITDKHLVVSSVNLNKINLGFSITNRYWRGNTESISVCSDAEILENAKTQYLAVYNESIEIETKLAEKIESFVGNMLTSKFALRSRQEVKALFARLIIRKEIEVKKFVFDVGKITAALMRIFNRNIVEKDDFLSALILYYLSERKHDFNELNEKLNLLNTEIDLRNLLARLLDKNLIEKTDDFYKIKLDFLLRGGLINEM